MPLNPSTLYFYINHTQMVSKHFTAYACIMFIILTSISITIITFGATTSNQCDHSAIMGFDINIYLIIFGTISLLSAILVCLANAMLISNFIINNNRLITFYIITGNNIAINLLLFACGIVGIFIMFKENIHCVTPYAIYMIFMLIIWLLLLSNILCSCLQCRFRTNTNQAI